VFTDAHCHPFDLALHFPDAENERRRLGVMCAASATTLEEFIYCEKLAKQAEESAAALLLPCFAIHPQATQIINNKEQRTIKNEELKIKNDKLVILDTLAAEGRLGAVGETGFDLYNAAFRETEIIQEELFAAHLDIAVCYNLPVVIHARRAMHKVFSYVGLLKKCKSVIFHSWSGTQGEGEALLRRGINAFFSFGTVIMLNHKEAMRCCAVFPRDRILIETDAPYQPPRGEAFSNYACLTNILETAAALRQETGLEEIVEKNFRSAFGC